LPASNKTMPQPKKKANRIKTVMASKNFIEVSLIDSKKICKQMSDTSTASSQNIGANQKRLKMLLPHGCGLLESALRFSR
jgi:hypothetical protein